jgi:glutamate receptor ionotropic, NMDA 1
MVNTFTNFSKPTLPQILFANFVSNQNFLCFFSKDDAYIIFRDAALNNMTGAGHVWIVTEQALYANNTPIGILGLQLNYANSENEHIRVSIF